MERKGILRIVISAGPTRERIDAVRYISNRSSGKMGYALAEAAVAMGHDVTVISGPVSLRPVRGARTVRVETAEDMLTEVLSASEAADVLIMSAAVSDYRPLEFFNGKIKKTKSSLTLKLERTEDILSRVRQAGFKGCLVGFCAETEDVVENAWMKLHGKKLDWIVANDVSLPDRGFDSDDNAATLLSSGGKLLEFELQSKKELAGKILAAVLGELAVKKTT